MISCQNINKDFQKIKVLKGVSFDIEEGRSVSIVGSSGAGKSTLLHILGTLDQADSGKIIINGKDISSLGRKEIADFRNKEIGFIFQFHHLLPEFTAIENVTLPAFIAKREEQEAKQKAEHLLQYLGLQDRIHHKPSQLSGGEQQRVAIARALINAPKLLLADEPTGNLDQKNAHEVFELLLKLQLEYNLTMVLVTHDVSLSNKTNHTLTMKDGVIIS